MIPRPHLKGDPIHLARFLPQLSQHGEHQHEHGDENNLEQEPSLAKERWKKRR